MANTFSNNKKTKLIAGTVYSYVPYLKKAHSYIPASELEGKKYGRTYTVYIPDPGTAVNGIVADPDQVKEAEVEVTLDNINTSVEINAWNKLTDIESFTEEIAIPRGRMLARELSKNAINKTIHCAAQAVVGESSFSTLSFGCAALDEVGVAGNKVSFIKPTAAAKIAATGLANFLPTDIMKEVYTDKYLGQYAGAAQVEESLMPEVTIKAGTATLVWNEVVADDVADNSCYNLGSITGNALHTYSIDGLKVVDKNGICTEQPFTITVGADGKSFAPVRVAVVNETLDGRKTINANAWVDSADKLVYTAELIDGLEAGTTYMIGQARSESAVGLDTYKFADLPGSDNSTESFDSISIKMSQYGDGMNMVSLVRLDVPHAICLPDQRDAVLMYMKK